MIKYLISGLILFSLGLSVKAQTIQYFDLSEKLQEISGLELINDSTLVAFNDGGNKSEVYLLNLEGKIIREVDIEDTKNRDWEDIAVDDKYVYIGDIGNNENKRDNLVIYRLKITDLLEKKDVKPDEIKFNYGEQRNFPPSKDSMFYDAEGMTYYNDSIWIFTKDRSQPTDGYSLIYKVPAEPGEYTVYKAGKTFIGKDGWWKDGITAVDVYDDDFYILTYNRYIVKHYEKGRLKDVSTFEFNSITQRESIVVLNKESIFVADEKNPLVGDMKLYNIRL